MADQVLHSGVRSITDLMVLPGLINLDFADVRTVMTEMGKAMMGTGEASGEGRALMAAENAIQNPLLDEVSLKGAKAVLVNVTGGLDMTLLEVDEAANAISAQVDPEANIIFGAAFDPALEGKIRVSVVATGMDGAVDRRHRARRRAALIAPAPQTPLPSRCRSPSPSRPYAAEPASRAGARAGPPAHGRARSPNRSPSPPPEPAMLEPPPIQPADACRAADDRLSRSRPIGAETPRSNAAGEPSRGSAAAGVRPIARIVDPSVADRRGRAAVRADSRFGGRQRAEERLGSAAVRPVRATIRRRRCRPRRPAASRRSRRAGDRRTADDDLEIPSFLRRLAN